jgi:transcriptional regulator with PAS, ATPase and Fis domain
MREGRFREDLFYRLNVIPIHLPPLRERREDIALLVDYFLDKYNKQNSKRIRKISRQVLYLLMKYPWPGNVRELENCIERAVIMSPGEVLSGDFLPEEILSGTAKSGENVKHAAGFDSAIRQATEELCEQSTDLAYTREAVHRLIDEIMIRKALARKMSQRKIADELGISRMTLRKKMRGYGIIS